VLSLRSIARGVRGEGMKKGQVGEQGCPHAPLPEPACLDQGQPHALVML